VAKFSGHTSHGTMKVTQIFALSGHSMTFGFSIFAPFVFLRDLRDLRGSTELTALSSSKGG